MKLLANHFPSQNLLPYDGEVYLYEQILTETDHHYYLKKLEAEITWKQEGIRLGMVMRGSCINILVL